MKKFLPTEVIQEEEPTIENIIKANPFFICNFNQNSTSYESTELKQSILENKKSQTTINNASKTKQKKKGLENYVLFYWYLALWRIGYSFGIVAAYFLLHWNSFQMPNLRNFQEMHINRWLNAAHQGIGKIELWSLDGTWELNCCCQYISILFFRHSETVFRQSWATSDTLW